MQSLVTSKVFWGIVLTGVLGALTAIQAVNPQWAGTIGLIVSALTLIGHSTNVIKGIR